MSTAVIYTDVNTLQHTKNNGLHTVAQGALHEELKSRAYSLECPTGWLRYDDQCVLLVTDRFSIGTFQLAREFCQRVHADLIVIKDQGMNDWLADKISIYNEIFWIGLWDRRNDGSFLWVDGTEMTWDNWSPGEPNNEPIAIGEDCVEIYSNGKWNDEQCAQPQNYICSRNINVIPQCDVPNGWEGFDGKCYRWVSDTKNIAGATEYCTMLGGYVISINSDNEQDFAGILQAAHLNLPYWTGLSDKGRDEGDYIWQDGTVLTDSSYTNWGTLQPNTRIQPGCAMVKTRNGGNWTIDNCDDEDYRFICEKDEGVCQDGWVIHGGQCYQFNDFVRTWWDAKYYCEAQGGWIASILDENENLFIATEMQRLYEENVETMWFGYSDTLQDGQWAWEHDTGLLHDYEHWVNGIVPAGEYGKEDCAFMYTDDSTGLWQDQSCLMLGGFVCKIAVGSEVTPVIPDIELGYCERGWALYDNFCYTSPAEFLSWEDSRDYCRNLFDTADLASVTSSLEQNFLTERIRFIDDDLWIGYNDIAIENTWVWTDGSPSGYENWYPGEPNNVGNEDCAHIDHYFYKIGTWNDHKCSNENRFVCKMPKFAPSGRCGTGWMYDENSMNCFWFVTDWLNQNDADVQCQLRGGFLTSILSPVESVFLFTYSEYYRLVDGITHFWIGLHDSTQEQGFLWTDGSPVSFLNWADGEPNDYGQGEDCVELMTSNGQWNDVKCDDTNPYICRRSSFITIYFVAYTGSQLDATGETPVSNVYPQECAALCYASGQACLSFNYNFLTRSCSLLAINKDSGSASLESSLTTDYYERDFSAPTYAPQTTLDPTYGCGLGETSYRSSCYTLVDTAHSIDDMKGICQMRSSELVSISDAGEMDFVISLMQTGNTDAVVINDVWLGLSDEESEGWYRWLDGSYVTYTRWAAGEPNNDANEDDCVIYDYILNGWVDVPCSGVSTYGVCEKDKTTTNVVDPDTEGCPTGWLKYMSTCYLLVDGTEKKTWDNARQDCLSRNARLAVITTKYEQAYLASLMAALHVYDGEYYIGLSDTQTPGTYRWVDGSYPTLSPWGPGQPDDTRFGQCVAMVGPIYNEAGLWMDVSCTLEHNYICEQPMEGTTDTPYTMAPVTNPSNVGCDDDERELGYGDFCYTMYEGGFNTEKMLTWSQAEVFCNSKGGHLASYHSSEEEAYFLENFTPNNTVNNYGFWLGINDHTIQGGWEWTDSTAVIYTNWEPNEPSGASGEDCSEMFLNPGRGWNDVICSVYRNWVCKRPKQFEPEPTLPPVTRCPSNLQWDYAEPYCYFVSDFLGDDNARMGWFDAETECMRSGGHLASIESEQENALIVSLFPLLTGVSFWIGLRQQVFEGPYEWVDGTPFIYENWSPNEPNNAHGEETCVELYRFDGKCRLSAGGEWNDQNCGVRAPFVCKKREGADPITSSPTESPIGGCDNGYFKYYGRCYKMVGFQEEDQRNWMDARTICRNDGGDLVGIHSHEVQSLLTSMIIDSPTDVWIGFSDLGSTGQYHWTDGKSTSYTNWYPGQPNGFITFPGESTTDCVELLREEWYAGMWNDVNCNEVIAYVCERDASLPDNPPEDTFCDDGSYYSYNDSCYKLVTTSMTHQAAQDFCASEGGNLASIYNGFHEAFLEYLLYSNGVTSAWIGMTGNEDGEYSWSDGFPVHFSKWGEDEPSAGDNEGCVMLTNTPAWDDTNCATTRPFICRTTSTTPPPPVEEHPGYCPEGLEEFDAYCYYFPPDNVFFEWYSARYECQRLGGDLASIHSKAENEFIREIIQSRFGFRDVWIGLTRSEDGGFMNTDNTPVDYVNWANGEPSGDWRGSSEDCVEMYTNNYGTWNNADCFSQASFLCKFDIWTNGTDDGVDPEPRGGLSGGAIAGIVIACLVVVTAAVLVVVWFMASRDSKTMSSSATSDFPTPAPPAGFDNALYVASSKETKIQVDDKATKSEA
ncbi:macrophage mannose receptor 1-like [Diadema antillarum]|uniref:macrophage mannose receptor 1-like n=1 Tax=Diadema antillarum TaxID=105358 RepID=UPI003A8B60A5